MSSAQPYAVMSSAEMIRLLEAKDAVINAKDAVINAKDAAITTRDSTINANAALIAEQETLIAKLRHQLANLARARFGVSSERLNPDQLQLALEDAEQTDGAAEAREEAAPAPPRKPRKPAKRNLGALPAHLPRVRVDVPPEETTCPCCGGPLHQIRDEVAERLHVIPAVFQVQEIHRPVMGCRACEAPPIQAPAPPSVMPGGMASTALVAHVVIAKYCDHTPLYRQAGIYARQGITLDRATLANWVGRAAELLDRLSALVLADILRSEKIFADDTVLPVLDPGRGKVKQGRLWTYARDDRPWCGQAPPAVAYLYAEDRKATRPKDHLTPFAGILQVDAYAGFDGLPGVKVDGTVRLAHCWTHTRRKFHEVSVSSQSPSAAEAIRRIGELYAIEAEIRGRPADERLAVRQERSRPLVDALKAWLMDELGQVSGKMPLAAAIRYALSRWDSLCLFLADGRVELDTNTVERSIRPIKLGAKNHLFAGSDGGGVIWGTLATLIQTARLNGVDPAAYLEYALDRIVAGHPVTRLAELLPWEYARAIKTTAAAPASAGQ